LGHSVVITVVSQTLEYCTAVGNNLFYETKFYEEQNRHSETAVEVKAATDEYCLAMSHCRDQSVMPWDQSRSRQSGCLAEAATIS